MSETSAMTENLEARIRAIRLELRARQPIEQRIDLVRARHRARRKAKNDRLR